MGQCCGRLDISQVDDQNIDTVPYRNQEVECKVTQVYDGDTCTVVFLYGDKPFKIRIRLAGIDAPEVKFKTARAERAKKYLEGLVLDKKVILIPRKWDKYGGRLVGELRVGGRNVSELLKIKKLVRSYDGKKKIEW